MPLAYVHVFEPRLSNPNPQRCSAHTVEAERCACQMGPKIAALMRHEGKNKSIAACNPSTQHQPDVVDLVYRRRHSLVSSGVGKKLGQEWTARPRSCLG